jgi:hypothetical protein
MSEKEKKGKSNTVKGDKDKEEDKEEGKEEEEK